MTNLQVHWYNKLVDEIVRRYINDVTPFPSRNPFDLHLSLLAKER